MTGRPLVLAHRGGALEAPENSVEAFERAIRLGYPGVELDVRCSKDGVPLVVHDAEVRTAPGRPHRTVRDSMAAELTVLPTLDRVLGLPWGAMTLMVEVKREEALHRDRDLASRVAQAIVRSRLRNAVFASFSVDILATGRKAEPSLPLVAIVDGESFSKEDWRQVEGLSFLAWAVDLAWLERDRAAVRWMRGRGGQIWAWTIADLDDLNRALALGVDGVITDVPGAVLKHLDAPRA